jgi:integrase
MKRREPTNATFDQVIDRYLSSPQFQGYAPTTQAAWKHELLLAQEVMGKFSIETIRPSIVQAFLDTLSKWPGKQRVARAALKAVEGWALVRDYLQFPITTGTTVDGQLGGHIPWTDAQVILAETYSSALMARIVTLGANTGQRGSDLVRMGWGDIEIYQGRSGINVTQQKTGRQLWVPMTQELQAAISGWEKRPGPFIERQITRNALSVTWVRERDRSEQLRPLRELTIHGLRATACVRLRRMGAQVPQIADYVGMSEAMVARYCRLSDQRENALAAVVHLDRYVSAKKQQNQR